MEVPEIKLGTILRVIGILASVFAVIYVVDAYVDRKIDRAIASPAYLKQVAAQVRPSVIFTSAERIVADMGGLARIDSLRVVTADDGLPERVIVVTKEWNGLAPILTSGDETIYEIHERQEAGNRWEYDVRAIMYQSVDSGGPPTRSEGGEFLFRLELVP